MTKISPEFLKGIVDMEALRRIVAKVDPHAYDKAFGIAAEKPKAGTKK